MGQNKHKSLNYKAKATLIHPDPDPDAFLGSSSRALCATFESRAASADGRFSCWCVSLCQAAFRNPSFLWSSADAADSEASFVVNGESLLTSQPDYIYASDTI